MTIKEAILKSLDDLKRLSTHIEIYNNIVDKNYYNFGNTKTPKSSVSGQLSDFSIKDDERVKRVKGDGNYYLYYLTKHEQEINMTETQTKQTPKTKETKQTYHERDLHKLLSSWLKNKNIYSKTILHEISKQSKDEHQKWIHPDMVGVEFLKLKTDTTKAFMKNLNILDTIKLFSYELKKEIRNDHELKKCYFQAVSNSSWANYGYLVVFEIDDNLKEEINRLHQSFGIGVIELNANPYQSKILHIARYKELDYKTIDKLCLVNENFKEFIGYSHNMLTIEEVNFKHIENSFDSFCDGYFINDNEINEYNDKCKIPYNNDE